MDRLTRDSSLRREEHFVNSHSDASPALGAQRKNLWAGFTLHRTARVDKLTRDSSLRREEHFVNSHSDASPALGVQRRNLWAGFSLHRAARVDRLTRDSSLRRKEHRRAQNDGSEGHSDASSALRAQRKNLWAGFTLHRTARVDRLTRDSSLWRKNAAGLRMTF
jgi:hypothetical protein